MLLPTSAQSLNKQNLKSIIYGACFLASGGGGPISMALQFLQRIKDDCSVSLQSVSSLEHNKTSLMVVDLGSPDAAAQGYGFSAPVNAFRQLSEYLQQQDNKVISYLLPGERGAVNSLIPFYIAAMLDGAVSVLDADPCGRADPRLSETLLDLADIDICPAIIASDDLPDSTSTPAYDYSLFTGLDPEQLEEKARETVSQPQYHQVGGMACYPLDTNFLLSAQAKNALVYQSISAAMIIGDYLLNSTSSAGLAELLNLMHIDNFIFIDGDIQQIINRTSGGFDVGKIIITSDQGTFWVYYKNESLLAWDVGNQCARAIAPDCINMILDKADSSYAAGTPISTADISEGQSITLWGTACPEKVRVPGLISQFLQDLNDALSAFPEDHISISQYIPIEQLNNQAQ